MKILILNYEFPPVGGGGGRVSAALAREFVAQGHTVRVVTSACDTLPKRETQDGYEIVRVPVLRRNRDRCSIPEMVSYMGLSIWPVLREVRRFQPDMINAHFGIPTGPLALLVRLLQGKPYVLTIHAGDVPGFMPEEVGLYHNLIRPVTRFIWQKSARVVAVSNGIKRMALQTAPDLRVDVIHNGIQLSEARCQRSAPTHPYKMLFVGRIADQKGLDTLIHALGQMQRRDWQLTIVGDGPKRAKIESLIADYRLQDTIHFAGWLNHTEVIQAYQTHDLFVLPSVTEGMPVVMLEAMSYALPLIGTDVNGTQDLIEHHVNGWLVPPMQPTLMAGAIESALNATPEKLHEMGQASQHKAYTHFTWDALARDYLRVFEDVLHA